MIAALGETAASGASLRYMRDKMLMHPVGRKILRDRPIVSSTSLQLDSLRKLEPGTFGRDYISFLDSHKFNPDERSKVKYIQDEELAYVMTRYRQIHDFYHVLTGLGVSVEEEIALKWLELTQTGLPMTLLSSIVGPARLTSLQRERLFGIYVPWAIQCGSASTFLLNVHYEKHFNTPTDTLRKQLKFFPPPAFTGSPSSSNETDQ